MDAEERVGGEDERYDDLAGSERAVFEESVGRVREHVPAVGTPDAGTAIAGLDGSFATLRAGASSQACLQCRSMRRSSGSGRNSNEVSSTRCRSIPSKAV